MKKKILGIFIVLVIGIFSISFLRLSKQSNWEYEKLIKEPVKATSTNDAGITLGDIEEHKVSVSVSKGAFDNDTEVVLSNPNKVPNISTAGIDTIGAPIELGIGEAVRLNEKATITFAYDKSLLPAETEAYQIRVVYFNGENWDYIKPTSINFDKGLMTFETYHFSLFGVNRIKDDTKITEAWIRSQALDNKLKEGISDVSDQIAGKVVDLILEKMGISDKSIKGQVVGEILKDDGYKEIYDSYKSGDIAGFNQKIAILAGSKIANNVPSSVLSEALGSLGGAAEDIEAVSKAAGYMAAGQYKDAAKIIGEQISDKFLITTAGKIAVEVIDGQIQSWKNSEVEAAFKAYRDGASGYFYGYNVDKGDFEGVWKQMRGIRRQLELEAVKKENDIRKESGMAELTERQVAIIHENVKQTYKKQFTKREEQETEIKKEEEKLKAIMKAFEEADFFGRIPPKELDKGYELENKLEIVNHFVQKMMEDINRFELTDKEGLIVEGKVNVNDLVLAGRYYFSGPDGKQKYREYLRDRFGISMYPKLEDLKGEWSGTMTIINVDIEELTEEIEKQLEEAGCDVSSVEEENFHEMEGKEQPISLSINPESETNGQLGFSNEGKAQDTPFTYNSGVITASMTEKGAIVTIILTPSQQGNSYSASGTMNVNLKDFIKISGTISVSKKR